MENISFVRDDLKFELHIIVDKLHAGTKHSKTVEGHTFSYQEMLDEKGNRFYFIDASSNCAWKHFDTPVIRLINYYFELELMQCVVHSKGGVGYLNMAVDSKAIKLPAVLEYRPLSQEPGIYANIDFPPSDFLDPLRLDYNGNVIPSKFSSIKEIPDQGPDFVF